MGLDLAARVLLAHRAQVGDGQIGGQLGRHVIQDVAHGRVGATHHGLHAANGTDEMRAIDAVFATGADEHVLGVIGDANHLVRHQLAHGDDALPVATGDLAADLAGHGKVELCLGHVAHERAWDLTELGDGRAKVVDQEAIERHAREHVRQLLGAHGLVRAEGGQHLHFGIGRQPPIQRGRQLAGSGMRACRVGRDQQHAFGSAEPSDQVIQQLLDGRWR